MSTRLRRDPAFLIVFLFPLKKRGQGGSWRNYLERSGSSLVGAPVVVQVEAYQPQDGNVKENLPTGHESAITIQHVTQLPQRRDKQPRHVAVAVTRKHIVGEEDRDVENPGSQRDVALGQPGGQGKVEPEDGEDLEDGEAVEDDEEEDGKGVVKGGPVLEPAGAVALELRRRAEGLVESAQQGVEDEEHRHVRQVLAKGAVLVVGVVNLSPEEPSIRQQVLVLVISRVPCCILPLKQYM